MGDPFTVDAEGAVLAVKVTPRASRTAPVGVVALPDGRSALAVRVAAPPVEGEANAALCTWLARALGVRKAAVTIRSGDTGRLKIVRIVGDGPALAAALIALAAV